MMAQQQMAMGGGVPMEEAPIVEEMPSEYEEIPTEAIGV